MTDRNKTVFTDSEMQTYFSNLPASAQENIMQSGVDFKSLSELKSYADNYLHRS
ncbi:MAG: hypothetical protein Q8882_02235 [Bacillota bacterium]|nr:hypothetical protein [Bacillota bacterium]